MRANNANRLAALHQQRLVRFQFLQALDDCIEALPVTRSLSTASVHHQVLGAFRNFWIQIVHQHAHSGFSGPGLAGALVSARGANDSMCNGGHGGAIVGTKANILTAIARCNSSSGSADNRRPRPGSTRRAYFKPPRTRAPSLAAPLAGCPAPVIDRLPAAAHGDALRHAALQRPRPIATVADTPVLRT